MTYSNGIAYKAETRDKFSYRVISSNEIRRKWSPKENETCIFYNAGDSVFMVAKFVEGCNHGFAFCEPYMGQSIEDLNF
jgi:hypothetical protein